MSVAIATPSMASVSLVEGHGDWASAALPGERVTFARTVNMDVGGGPDVKLDVHYLIDHDCAPAPSLEFSLAGLPMDMVTHTAGLFAVKGSESTSVVPKPEIRFSFTGEGVEPNARAWSVENAYFLSQYGNDTNNNLLIPLHRSSAGINQTVEGIKQSYGIDIELVLYQMQEDDIVSRSFKPSFSLKGSLSAVRRAAQLCRQLAQDRQLDSGRSKGVIKVRGSANKAR